ncbi:MAG: hypothetical protein HY329_09730 [Chloroflexi bacterium]|nr:hypothetical protein [Chloroflexota bacterium]
MEPNADVLREGVQVRSQALLELEVSQRPGAERYQPEPQPTVTGGNGATSEECRIRWHDLIESGRRIATHEELDDLLQSLRQAIAAELDRHGAVRLE